MKPNTRKLDSEIQALLRLRDEDIDTSDIPEVTDWSKAVVGKFYRPVKEPVTIRLDVDILTRLKAEGPGYQTRINALLRSAMNPEMVGNSTPKGPGTGTEKTETAVESRQPSANFRFPNLERRNQLARYSQVAQLIERRGSVFAPAA